MMADTPLSSRTRERIRAIADYPTPGILFQDITPLLADGEAFGEVVEAFVSRYRDRVDVVVGIEARGFILAAPVAIALGVGFVPVRKQGKLPHATIGATYDLEYGTASVEMHADGILPGQRVLVLDDVLATGGTAEAACSLVREVGGEVAGIAVLMELSFLHGRSRLAPWELQALITV